MIEAVFAVRATARRRGRDCEATHAMTDSPSAPKPRSIARSAARESLFRIGRYELDAGLRLLRRDGAEQKIQPRVFDLILYLVRHRDRVVSAEELLRALWPDVHVDKGSLYQAVKGARAALDAGSGAEEPIVAVYGRGYRFAAPVAEGERRGKHAVLAGRRAELHALDALLDQAVRGARRIAFVTGEAGIGKTALLDRVEDAARAAGMATVATAQCLESHEPAEPYRPVLEALESVCRTAAGRALAAALRRAAPTWLADIPSLRAAGDLPHDESATARTHRVRELADALEQAGVERPLVLLLEDLHWADPSTLDLLQTLARRREPTRLLVIATLRPTGPARALADMLRHYDGALEIPLGFLSEAHVAEMLEDRFPAGVADGLASWLHGRTSGNPLFVLELLTSLLDGGALHETPAGRVELARPLDALAPGVPATVRTLIERHVAAFVPEDRALLEVAAVVGRTAPAALVASGTADVDAGGAALEEVESRLHAVMRRTGCLVEGGLESWPDGTVSGRYRFVHELHRDSLYEAIPLGRRARLHRRIAARLEAAFASGDAPLAVLAHHFDRGAEAGRALVYYERALQLANRRCARDEGLYLAARALALAKDLEDETLRERAELDVRFALSPILTRSPAHPEAEANLLRAQALCEAHGDRARLASVLWARCYAALQREERGAADEIASALLATAERLGDPGRIALAHAALAQCHAMQCRFGEAIPHGERAILLHDCARDRALLDEAGLDVGVGAAIAAGFALWQSGRVGDAFARVEAAVAHARNCGHAYSLAWALNHAALFHYGAAALDTARGHAREAIRLATARGWDIDRSFGELFLAASTDPAQNRVPAMASAVAGFPAEAANESQTGRIAVMTLFAEAFVDAGDCEQASATIDAALAAGALLPDNPMEPALRRLKAQLLLDSDAAEAETELRRALAVARRLGVRVNELRVASSLARLAAARGERTEARSLLAPCVAAFAGEPAVEAVAEARALLAELDRHALVTEAG